jgi:hypothetical protein
MRHALWTLQAGQAGLEGRTDEAIRSYRDALEGHRSTGLRRSEALLGLQMAKVLGPDHPAVAEPLESARRIFTELRARAWLDRLDDIVAAAPARAVSTTEGETVGTAHRV